MTGKAAGTIGLDVGLHKIGFDLLVAGCTHVLVELGIVRRMTIHAREGASIRLDLVCLKGIPESIMRNIGLGQVSQ